VDWSWKPNSSTASGMSATEGTGRRNSIVEAVYRRSTSMLPSSRPREIPATSAMDNPIPHPSKVSVIASQNPGVCTSATIAVTIALSGGK
jgi:hypothetical protein